jgi:hypothetical protein
MSEKGDEKLTSVSCSPGPGWALAVAAAAVGVPKSVHGKGTERQAINQVQARFFGGEGLQQLMHLGSSLKPAELELY